MFPLEKYKYYVDEEARTVVAVQTFAKKKYRGIAKCSKEDAFDVEKGKKIAALKCNKKITQARLDYAKLRYEVISRFIASAKEDFKKWSDYLVISYREYNEALVELDKVLKGE